MLELLCKYLQLMMPASNSESKWASFASMHVETWHQCVSEPKEKGWQDARRQTFHQGMMLWTYFCWKWFLERYPWVVVCIRRYFKRLCIDYMFGTFWTSSKHTVWPCFPKSGQAERAQAATAVSGAYREGCATGLYVCALATHYIVPMASNRCSMTNPIYIFMYRETRYIL